MIGRIRRRETFASLRRSPRSARAGILRVSLVEPDPLGPPIAVAFGISRRVGTAVRRNRLRRQLRAILVELDDAGRLAPGQFLVTVVPHAAPPSSSDLRRWLESALDRLDRDGSDRTGRS